MTVQVASREFPFLVIQHRRICYNVSYTGEINHYSGDSNTAAGDWRAGIGLVCPRLPNSPFGLLLGAVKHWHSGAVDYLRHPHWGSQLYSHRARNSFSPVTHSCYKTDTWPISDTWTTCPSRQLGLQILFIVTLCITLRFDKWRSVHIIVHLRAIRDGISSCDPGARD